MREASRNPVGPLRPYLFFGEDERSGNGQMVSVNTLFLTNRECPWRCVMCDLWQYTTTTGTPEGAIPAQIAAARRALVDRRTSRGDRLGVRAAAAESAAGALRLRQ